MQWLDFIKAHWGWFTAFGAPLLLTLIASVVNRFGDPDNDPATPPPKWVRAFMVVADVLAWVPRPGMRGIAGPVNAPGFVSKEVPDDA